MPCKRAGLRPPARVYSASGCVLFHSFLVKEVNHETKPTSGESECEKSKSGAIARGSFPGYPCSTVFLVVSYPEDEPLFSALFVTRPSVG